MTTAAKKTAVKGTKVFNLKTNRDNKTLVIITFVMKMRDMKIIYAVNKIVERELKMTLQEYINSHLESVETVKSMFSDIKKFFKYKRNQDISKINFDLDKIDEAWKRCVDRMTSVEPTSSEKETKVKSKSTKKVAKEEKATASSKGKNKKVSKVEKEATIERKKKEAVSKKTKSADEIEKNPTIKKNTKKTPVVKEEKLVAEKKPTAKKTTAKSKKTEEQPTAIAKREKVSKVKPNETVSVKVNEVKAEPIQEPKANEAPKSKTVKKFTSKVVKEEPTEKPIETEMNEKKFVENFAED